MTLPRDLALPQGSRDDASIVPYRGCGWPRCGPIWNRPLHGVRGGVGVCGLPRGFPWVCLPCQREVARPEAVTEGLPYGWLPFERSGMPVGFPCGGLSLE